ncbi:MAG: hypothetical protein JXM73_25020, partial [Anaerolineae bacterium]|nr:hypothetical protein [Anaerolineae bacterium]
MNQTAKRAIKALVLELRHSLEDDIAVQLKRYGYAGGRWIDPARLPHIWNDDTAMAERQRMDAALAQELRRMGVAAPDEATPKQREEAVGWFVREIAYTHLNRLVALKALEVRGLIPEVITTRDAYGGRSRAHYDLRNAHPELARGADEGLAEAIRQVSRRVYRDFRLLFDVGDPAEDRPAPVNTLVWPSHTTLRAAVAAINDLDARAETDASTLWLEDEIIGWLYQFYNAEQKEAIRSRGKPRRPAEVAVINQFFTPRWVVKFLVDNTLGRLWLEMHPDSERVRAKCDYLVPEPLPSPSEGEGPGVRVKFPLDPDSPINNLHAAPRRPAKRPQEIRLIDPACGTMHFGHYAFEVFQAIYDDAFDHGWLDAGMPQSRIQNPKSKIDVPAAILRYNLYGVDIDLRAVQLAGLSLYMKARTAEAALLGSPAQVGLDETRINQVNLVVADAVLPEDGPRSEFLKQYADNKPVQRAVAQVLDEMANVAEVGSLLRVEERLRQSLADAGYEPPEAWRAERQRNLPGLEPSHHQLSLADAPGVDPDQWGAHYTVDRLLEDLRAFAARALRQHDLNAQLFAQEASKGVQLLDVFLDSYDVLVMNPPYGQALDWSLITNAQEANYNLYCAFLLRARELIAQGGYVGALTDRTYMQLVSFENFRMHLLHALPILAAVDLGWDVLDDANVATCAAIFGRANESGQATFVRCLDVEAKEEHYQSRLNVLKVGEKGSDTFTVDLKDFEIIPTHPYSYWAPRSIVTAFRDWGTLEPSVAIVRKGLSPGHSPRFVREHWEVRPSSIGMHYWAPYANGGSFSPYYRDNESVVFWLTDGQEIKSLKPKSVIRSEALYGMPGLTYGKRHHLLNVQFLEEGHIFSNEGYIIRTERSHDDSVLASLLNSNVIRFCINLIAGLHKEVTSVKSLPVPLRAFHDELPALRNSTIIYKAKRAWDTGNELCTRFDVPWLVQASRGQLLADSPDLHPATQYPTSRSANLLALLDHVHAVEIATDARLQALQAVIDEAVYGLYEISLEDRVLIEREL